MGHGLQVRLEQFQMINISLSLSLSLASRSTRTTSGPPWGTWPGRPTPAPPSLR